MDIKKMLERLKSLLTEMDEKPSTKKGEMYFILIGIDQYSYLNNLNFCKSDSESFLNLWTSQSKYNIKRKNVYKLYDFAATKLNILSLFDTLSKTISFNDKIIIHFAGHEFTNYKVKFFVPADGSKNNIYSCLSSLTINHYVKDIKCSNILMIGNTFDLHSDKKSSWQSILKNNVLKDSEISGKQNIIYDSLIAFLIKEETNRNKEMFFISREKEKNKITDEQVFTHYWYDDDKDLQFKLKEHYTYIKQLLNDGQVKEALNLVEIIVSNNDIKLKSEVETLKYKYEQNKSNYLTKSSERENILNTESQISKLSEGIVNKVHDCGFYLVHLPHQQKENLLIEKERNIILFISADPSDQSRLRLNDEFRNIEFELMRSKDRDLYELVPCLATRISDFQRKLLDLKPKYIHFSGHGNCQGICLISNDEGNTKMVENIPLAELFRIFSKYIKCVFLNSCHSINQSKPIGKFIENVICMNSSVDDQTAIHFASSFYASLASGQNINFSFDFAKNSIDLHKLSGSDIPLLLINTN